MAPYRLPLGQLSRKLTLGWALTPGLDCSWVYHLLVPGFSQPQKCSVHNPAGRVQQAPSLQPLLTFRLLSRHHLYIAHFASSNVTTMQYLAIARQFRIGLVAHIVMGQSC